MIFCSIAACSDLFEKDLEPESVVLTTPMDMDTLENYTVNFWWQELEGADNYRVQIVSGSFSLPNALIFDSISEANVFDLTLSPGEYEWRVKGINGSSETDYTTFSFFINQNEDLSQEQLIFKTPLNNEIFNTISVDVSWFLNLKANDYLLDVTENGSNVLPTITTSQDNAQISLYEGVFECSLQGRNNTSISTASARTFTIDTTAPAAPSLNLPLVNELVDTNFISFDWTHGSSLTSISDSLFIYSDSLVTLVDVYVESGEQSDITFSTSGVYYWRVRSVDQAGNRSAYSAVRKFTIL